MVESNITINKYDVMKIIDNWINNDEECSCDCFTCKYEKVCNQTDELKRTLMAIFKKKK